jgi:DNA-binding CsgD family transcriptional regulator
MLDQAASTSDRFDVVLSAALTARPAPANHVESVVARAGESRGLTRREREVLEAVASGRTGREIAALLGIAYKTERNHIASILQKLGAKSQAHAVALALARKIISL